MINASPQYALLGFDTGIYFLSAIREHGKNFASQDIRPSIDRIQTDFSFQRVNNWSGFINKSFISSILHLISQSGKLETKR